MLKRKFYDTLVAWKKSKSRECLLVKGARQIGKTYIIDYFGRTNYKSYIYVNFIEQKQFGDVFQGDLSAEEIFKRLTLVLPQARFVTGDTLIFLDEIQVCPNARTALKFLALDDRYDIIASGSLLGINYREISSVPVGYEKQVTMYSLDFEEFLWAQGYSSEAIALLQEFFIHKTMVPLAIHETMLKYLREYLVVGGMPAVVAEYVTSHHFGKVQELQEKILNSYLEDVAQYAETSEKPKIRSCYMSIPKQLAKENTKFQFSVVEKRATARKYGDSVQWLQDANLGLLCYNVTTPTFPLNAYTKEDQYKLYLCDVGLLVAMYGFAMKKALVDDTLSGPAKGGIYENLVADILVKRGHKLHYYRSPSGDVEIEFLLNEDTNVIPLEVKAKKGKTLSLNKLLALPNIPYGYKFTSGNVGVSDNKITLPLYMAMFF